MGLPRLPGERKVFDGASALQLDCMGEVNGGSDEVKHEGLLALDDLSQSDGFSAPTHNGPSLAEMSIPLPVEPGDIKQDPGGDAPANAGVYMKFILFN